jgi:iron(III) transport system substrate-binding protein
MLITVDAGRIWRAQQRAIFQSVASETLDARVPSHLRHQDGFWFGLSKRARVIVYNKERGLPIEVSNYEDLADPALRGQVCMRTSSNIYNLSLMSSIIEAQQKLRLGQLESSIISLALLKATTQRSFEQLRLENAV